MSRMSGNFSRSRVRPTEQLPFKSVHLFGVSNSESARNSAASPATAITVAAAALRNSRTEHAAMRARLLTRPSKSFNALAAFCSECPLSRARAREEPGVSRLKINDRRNTPSRKKDLQFITRRRNQANWSRLRRVYVSVAIACVYIRGDRFTREIDVELELLQRSRPMSLGGLLAGALVRSDESIETCARTTASRSLTCSKCTIRVTIKLITCDARGNATVLIALTS